jgi:hypothetical protein
LSPGRKAIEKWSAGKPLDMLGALSLSKRRRRYIDCMNPGGTSWV